MVKFYADEQFPRDVLTFLRSLNYDVLTVQEAGNANQKISDEAVLAFATTRDRAVLTINRIDFIRLHKQQPNHSGIIACTENPDFERFATKIHEAVSTLDSLQGQLIRVYRDP
jgi:predicted nuclease of predicted toxin-antitoxin system